VTFDLPFTLQSHVYAAMKRVDDVIDLKVCKLIFTGVT